MLLNRVYNFSVGDTIFFVIFLIISAKRTIKGTDYILKNFLLQACVIDIESTI